MNIEVAKPRINASMLPKYHGQGVCLLGIAQAPDANGMSFQVKAADKQSVMVNMQDPLQEYVSGLIEVHGVVQSNNSIQCHNYVVFTPENAEEFDLELYNKSLMLMNQYPEHYIMGETS